MQLCCQSQLDPTVLPAVLTSSLRSHCTGTGHCVRMCAHACVCDCVTVNACTCVSMHMCECGCVHTCTCVHRTGSTYDPVAI